MRTLSDKRVLVVGVGGLGCPAAEVLARAGVGHITVADDDTVDASNLHRQTLYDPADVGLPKANLAARKLEQASRDAGHTLRCVAREIRLLPHTSLEIIAQFDLVLEGSDNFATKFLIADACAITRVPVVQAGAVRWNGWAMGSVPGRSSCLRCVFEDVPGGGQDTCAAAGVVGPVVGVLGALQAAIALRLLAGELQAAGRLWSYEGLSGVIRDRAVTRQRHCGLCSGQITDTHVSRYVPPECAA